MFSNASKTFFHLLAKSDLLKQAASRYGMRHDTSFARRFIAGETVEEAIAAARAIERRGLLHTLDYLGESVTSLAEAEAATRDYLKVGDAIKARCHQLRDGSNGCLLGFLKGPDGVVKNWDGDTGPVPSL